MQSFNVSNSEIIRRDILRQKQLQCIVRRLDSTFGRLKTEFTRNISCHPSVAQVTLRNSLVAGHSDRTYARHRLNSITSIGDRSASAYIYLCSSPFVDTFNSHRCCHAPLAAAASASTTYHHSCHLHVL